MFAARGKLVAQEPLLASSANGDLMRARQDLRRARSALRMPTQSILLRSPLMTARVVWGFTRKARAASARLALPTPPLWALAPQEYRPAVVWPTCTWHPTFQLA